ncbi:MAG: hypothetical protein Tsb002_12460 [Wenzhouxiangellaceae bacterium]
MFECQPPATPPGWIQTLLSSAAADMELTEVKFAIIADVWPSPNDAVTDRMA